MSVARQYQTTTRAPGNTVATPRVVPAQGVIATRPAIPVSMFMIGIVSVIVAAWGAAAPFAAPNFGYVADRAGAWQWSVTSACLGLGPGALAMLASLVVVAAVTRTSYARRVDLWALGLVITVCGAWFVVGQYVWPVIYGTHYISPSNVNHFMWKELTFAIGPGVILVFCGAVFMGWAIRRQLALVADRFPRTSVPSAGTQPGSSVRPRAMESTVGNTGTMAPPASAERPVTDSPVAERVDGPVAERVDRLVAERVDEPASEDRPASDGAAQGTGGEGPFTTATDATVKPSGSQPA